MRGPLYRTTYVLAFPLMVLFAIGAPARADAMGFSTHGAATQWVPACPNLR
jgi:hypothetical protein